MPLAGPYEPVQAPPLRPAPSGLVRSAVAVIDHDDNDDDWMRGVTWPTQDSAAVEGWDMCASDGTVGKAVGGTHRAAIGPTFAALVRDQCSAFGFAAADYQRRAAEAEAALGPIFVERQFERDVLGIGANFYSLAETYAADAANNFVGTQQLVGGAGVAAVDALALLDQAIANWGGGLGMIHAPAYLAAIWKSTGTLITNDGARMLSPNGNIVVAGNGYLGASPDGTAYQSPATTATGVLWAYATDLVQIHRQARPMVVPGSLAEALDRATNTVRFRAERVWAIEWSRLLHAAVKVTYSTTTDLVVT